ncbi:HNH endonuclease [Candidatus Neomarinimicrobiota bacterium]
MSRIILQPAGDKEARKHYIKTITNPVLLKDIEHLLSHSEKVKLINQFPSGELYIWGVVPGESNIRYWNRINPGDVTLFTRDNNIFSSGKVSYTTHNKRLAENLWGYNNGNTWEYIYFLDEIKTLDIDVPFFNQIVGYKPKKIVQGFIIMKKTPGERAFNYFDLRNDKFMHQLKLGDVINNTELSKIYLCGVQGGMRLSHKTNSLVLISDKTKGIYKDFWEGNVLHYTGMGLIGHQSLSFAQNKTLNESNDTSINVYLFEVFRSGEYTYQGRVFLAEKPSQEIQNDNEGHPREVWIFPLGLIDQKSPIPFNQKDLAHLEVISSDIAQSLNDDDLFEKLNQKSKGGWIPNKSRPKSSNTIKITYHRDDNVVEYARRRARGVCQLCNSPGPFKRKEKPFEPFLEVHHIKWLANNGPDIVENTVALCPNCHRKMHILDKKSDKQFLTNLDLQLKRL